MADDSIPRRDARFHVCQNNFVTYVNGHLADWGLASAHGFVSRSGSGIARPSTQDYSLADPSRFLGAATPLCRTT